MHEKLRFKMLNFCRGREADRPALMDCHYEKGLMVSTNGRCLFGASYKDLRPGYHIMRGDKFIPLIKDDVFPNWRKTCMPVDTPYNHIKVKVPKCFERFGSKKCFSNQRAQVAILKDGGFLFNYNNEKDKFLTRANAYFLSTIAGEEVYFHINEDMSNAFYITGKEDLELTDWFYLIMPIRR